MAGEQRLVHCLVWRYVDMRGPIVTVHAVHAAARSLGDLILIAIRTLSVILRYMTLHISDMNVGYHLPLLVGGNIFDLIGNVHMPVNAFRSTCGRIATPRLDEHTDLTGGVAFIAGKMGEDFELGTIEFTRPMALLTGVLRRAQVMHGRRDRPRKRVEGSSKHLTRP